MQMNSSFGVVRAQFLFGFVNLFFVVVA